MGKLEELIEQIRKNKFVLIIIQYFLDKNEFLTDISKTFGSDKNKDSDGRCSYINEIFNVILIVLLILIFIYIILFTFSANYYSANALLKKSFSNQIRLRDIPEFYQIKNIFYINDFISFDTSLILLMFSAILLIVICYYLDNSPQFKGLKIHFIETLNLFIILSLLILITGFIYYSINYNNLINLAKRNNILIVFFYKNINRDYIEKKQLCNYTDKKDILDSDFKLNKCNDIELNFSIQTLYDYIKDIMNEIYNDDNNITIDKFKTLQDKNGILYKDRLSSAFFTFSLMYYYTSNNLYDEAKELFAKHNYSINPILDLNYESVLLNKPDLSYNNNILMQTAFNHNKDIYYYVYNDYYNISSEIQNLIVDIYNICKYRMISIYTYYNFVFFMMIVIVIYYLIKKYMESN
uniref:Uncharacterized protein n=1 Tax=viral metagenome TaxID=1070528 RepID=A0A6C0CG04_9ZZZZ